MAGQPPNPVLRARIETAIRIASPLLDLVIAVSDRASRLLERGGQDAEVARMPSEGEHAPRGLRQRTGRDQQSGTGSDH